MRGGDTIGGVSFVVGCGWNQDEILSLEQDAHLSVRCSEGPPFLARSRTEM